MRVQGFAQFLIHDRHVEEAFERRGVSLVRALQDGGELESITISNRFGYRKTLESLFLELTHRLVSGWIHVFGGVCGCTEQRRIKHVVLGAVGALDLAHALFHKEFLCFTCHVDKLYERTVL